MASVTKSQSSESEVLPDGTVHQKICLTRTHSTDNHKVGEVIETFEHPPRLVHETETIEEVLPDGTKIKRQVAMNRVIHSYETRRESFDENNHTIKDVYNIEEVVPNTTSTFEEGPDSDYEEEVRMKRERGMSFEKDTQEFVEILPDGTSRIKKIRMNRVVHVLHDQSDSMDTRSGQFSEAYPTEEVVPGTSSAFDAGQDSD